MKRITPQRAVLFIAVMTAVAFVVYLPRLTRERRQAQAELRQQRAAANEAATQAAAANAAAQRAQYLALYLNHGFRRQPGLKTVAIAAEFQSGESDRPIADALASRFENPNLALITTFFKPAFYADGTFGKIFAGSTGPIYKLGLTNQLNGLLLAQEQVRYSTNGTEVDNVVTANTRLDVAFLPFDVMRREQSWTLLANGAGFSQVQARSNAEKRLLAQIAGDNRMSLSSPSSENQETYP